MNNLSLLALDYSKVYRRSLRNWAGAARTCRCYVRLRDWQNLEAGTAKANWGTVRVSAACLPSPRLTRTDKPAAAEHEWSAAVKDATSSESLVLLIQPVSEWGWKTKRPICSGHFSKRPEKQKDAFVALYQHYAKTMERRDFTACLFVCRN